MTIRAVFALLLVWVASPASALFTGNDQFDRENLNNEALLDTEYFTNLLAYSPFWKSAPAASHPRAYAQTSDGSLTGKRLYVRREVGIRGLIGSGHFWGYQLRQYDDLEEEFFYQMFEAQARLTGPLSVRIVGQPTGRKQDSDIGAGVVLNGSRGVLTVEGTAVDFNFNTRNLSDERDRRRLLNLRARAETPASVRWRGELWWEWDSPLEREFPDDDVVFGHRYQTAGAAAQVGGWLFETGFKREHRRTEQLASASPLQDFRRQAYTAEIARHFTGRPQPRVKLGLRVHRRYAAFSDYVVVAGSQDRHRWEANPYIVMHWETSEKTRLETSLFPAFGWKKIAPLAGAAGWDPYQEFKLKTALRIDFTPTVNLVLNPTWDLDRFFTRRTFDGGNVQVRLVIPN